MKKLILNKEELDYQNTCRQYFKKSFSASPSILTLVLQKPVLTTTKYAIEKGETLSDEQIQSVKENYSACLEKYKEKCLHISNWCEMHAENFYLDSLGTDITEPIFTMPLEYFEKAEKDAESMPEADAQNYKMSLGLNIIKMTVAELEEYNQQVLEDLMK